MIPYADFLYFGVLLYVAVPALLLGVAGLCSWRGVILVASVAMLLPSYLDVREVLPGVEIREVWVVAGYALFQWGVGVGFLCLRRWTARRWPFHFAVALALLPLIAVKYVPGTALQIDAAFLGISYVTFRSLDAIVCVQDRLIAKLPFGQYLAYLFFFGTISAGPIDRYRRFETDWKRRRTREEFLQDLDGAVHRVFRGFFYKFIAAALVKRYWLDVAAAGSGPWSTLSYMYAYSLHLFFDFAGYSAFAIGVSYLFGIHTPENFNRPFLARNIREFWNRWHVTLSWWLRDHVYMRFVMAATRGRWFRSRYLASYLGFFLAFGLMGLWHGAAVHYLLYGAYHGALLSAYEAFARWNKGRNLWRDGPLWRAAAVAVTFNCVCFGFLLFSGRLTGGGGASSAAVSGQHSYEGAFERASCEEIGGWARDTANPQAPVSVDIHVDGTRLATVRADLFRPDLAAAGRGSGAHGFLHVPPPGLKDGRPREIQVTIAGTSIALADHPKTIACVRGVQTMDGHDGVHESAGCDRISGWAWDATRPDAAVAVDIYSDGSLIATVVADRFRADLHDRGLGNGRHGFEYHTPPQLEDGRVHSIIVRIAGSNVTLRGTPKIIACLSGADARVSLRAPAEPERTAQGDQTRSARAAPVLRDNRDGTISDLTNGLMWEKKVLLDGVTEAANLHDADNCYPWGGVCAISGVDCRIDAECGREGPCQADDCQSPPGQGLTIFQWIERLNASKLAGHEDWRLPTSQEIYSIVNPLEEKVDPAITAAFNGVSCGSGCADLSDPACSCTNPGLYWAAGRGPAPDDSWMAYFYCMGNTFLDLKTSRFHVRAVRGGR